ncbi:MAG: sulfatase family protein [Rubripirellula sp.]
MIRYRIVLVALSAFLPLVATQAAEQPNVLIIMADDCTYNDLPMYGGQNAGTPNLEQFATEGLTFNHAYLAEAMCQPCRAELYTGLYPMRNGCAWNHSASLPGTQSMPHHLGQRGYRVGIAGKVHVLPKKSFPFENVGGFDKSCVRNPTKPHQLSAVDEFITRDSVQPFCLVVALVEPHVPWVMGDPSAYPPNTLKIPDNMADTKLTREALSRYLAEITYMDGQVGDLLQSLESSGQAGNTLVLFTSEQGSQFPGNKWTNWDTGVHTALIARWPGMVPAGKRTDAMVQYADVLPTLVDVAGGEVEAGQFDGESFLGVLKGEAEGHRKFVYGVHNNVPEGPPFPVRTVSDGTYRYVRNLLPENLYIEKHLMGIQGDGRLNNPYWQTWVWDSWESPRTYDLVQRYMHRPAEALYHTASDPYELENLADVESTAAIKRTLSAELDRWLDSQGDPGVDQDTRESHQAAKRGEHRYRPSGSENGE